MQRCLMYADMDHHGNRRIAHAVAFQGVGGTPLCPFQRLEPRAHAAFRIVEERINRFVQRVRTQFGMQRLPPLPTCGTGRPLRAQVPLALLRCPDVGEHQPHHIVLHHTTALNAHRWNDQPFLKQLGGPKRHAPRAHPTNIRMVCAHGGIADNPRRIVRIRNRFNHGEVGQVRAPMRGIIQQEDVARCRTTGTHRRDRLRHGTKVNGNVRRLRHHPASRVKQRAAGIAALPNVRRNTAALQQPTHLLGKHGNTLREHRELKRIKARP